MVARGFCDCGGRRFRGGHGRSVLWRLNSSFLGAAWLAVRPRLVGSLRIHRGRRMAGVAHPRVHRRPRGNARVPCSASSERTMDLAFLCLAPRRSGIRGNLVPLDAHYFHRRLVLANQYSRRSAAHTVFIVGVLRVGADIRHVAVKPRAVGMNKGKLLSVCAPRRLSTVWLSFDCSWLPDLDQRTGPLRMV